MKNFRLLRSKIKHDSEGPITHDTTDSSVQVSYTIASKTDLNKEPNTSQIFSNTAIVPDVQEQYFSVNSHTLSPSSINSSSASRSIRSPDPSIFDRSSLVHSPSVATTVPQHYSLQLENLHLTDSHDSASTNNGYEQYAPVLQNTRPENQLDTRLRDFHKNGALEALRNEQWEEATDYIREVIEDFDPEEDENDKADWIIRLAELQANQSAWADSYDTARRIKLDRVSSLYLATRVRQIIAEAAAHTGRREVAKLHCAKIIKTCQNEPQLQIYLHKAVKTMVSILNQQGNFRDAQFYQSLINTSGYGAIGSTSQTYVMNNNSQRTLSARKPVPSHATNKASQGPSPSLSASMIGSKSAHIQTTDPTTDQATFIIPHSGYVQSQSSAQFARNQLYTDPKMQAHTFMNTNTLSLESYNSTASNYSASIYSQQEQNEAQPNYRSSYSTSSNTLNFAILNSYDFAQERNTNDGVLNRPTQDQSAVFSDGRSFTTQAGVSIRTLHEKPLTDTQLLHGFDLSFGADQSDIQGAMQDIWRAIMISIEKDGNSVLANILFRDPKMKTYRDSKGYLPLHWAAFHGNNDAILCILDDNTNVNPQTPNEWTPLHWSAFQGHASTTQLLIKHNANVNAQTTLGETPLQWAAKNNHLTVVQILLTSGAKVALETALSGFTALHCAAQRGHLDVVKILLAWGTNVNQQADVGPTPLHCASQGGHLDVAKVLIDAGAAVNRRTAKGSTPLAVAGGLKMKSLLKSYGGVK